MKNVQYLGSLGLMQYFNHDGKCYRTITYAPSNTSPTCGTRWCLNMVTLQAEFIFCRVKVEPLLSDLEKNAK
jgi:hypothetical protein